MTASQRRARLTGRCTQCGKVNDRAPKWLCTDCFGTAYTPERMAANRAHAKAQRARRIARRLCRRCGSNPAAAFSWCLDCRQEHAARRRAA